MTALWSYAAIGLLVAGAAAAGSGDFALIVPGQPPICATSATTCEQARYAIRMGWLEGLMGELPTKCEPHPNCFSARSGCIPGYRGPRPEGHCR
jgi:hypothetical protein